MFHKTLHLHAPDFLLEELAKYKDEILKKTGQTEAAFVRLLNSLRTRLHFVAKEELHTYKDTVMKFAPDAKDWPYLAVALKTSATIWSNDSHLKDQTQVEVITTTELLAKIVPPP